MAMTQNSHAEWFHLVADDSAAGGLKYAISEPGLPGQVLNIGNDLHVGPLDSLQSRYLFLKAYYSSLGMDASWLEQASECFTPWAEVQRALAIPGANIAIWGGENVAESVMLMLACHWLPDNGARLYKVPVPDHPDVGEACLALYSPMQILDLWQGSVLLSERDKACARASLRTLLDGPRLRIWQRNGVVAVSEDFFDEEILTVCTARPMAATRVVGEVLGRQTLRHSLSDIYVFNRINQLTMMGKLDARRISHPGLFPYQVKAR